MADYTRSRTAEGKLRLMRNSTVREDLGDIVKGAALVMTPGFIKNRKADLLAEEDKANGMRRAQSTDAANKY